MSSRLIDWRVLSALQQKDTYLNPSLPLTAQETWTFYWTNSIYFIELLRNLKDMESA